jgi:tRNA pseudouridine65 synthase
LSATALELLYRDDHYVAVYKPADLSVHAGDLHRDHKVAMRLLRNQLGQRVYPVHRLDRPTAGVLIFALNSESAGRLSALFRERLMQKTYLAIARGHSPLAGLIDHDLAPSREAAPRPARTQFQRVATVELPIAVGPYPFARYSLVRAYPETGRYHQIRKHFHHISHHLIGDTAYGDGRHNRLFREHFNWHRLCLIAESLSFQHPFLGVPIHITTPGDAAWRDLIARLPWLYDPTADVPDP